MDRHAAYALLCTELAALRALPPQALIARAGTRQSTSLLCDGLPLEIETSLDWADRHRNAVRISVRALGSGHWHTQRLEESVVVAVNGPA